MAELTDYTELVPSSNARKPNFLAMLGACLQPFVDSINTIQSLPTKLDIDLASGDQLDIIGEWVNFPRRLEAPITGVYFSFGAAGPGFGAGVWFGPDDPAGELIELDDVTYRQFLKVKIVANHWDGSLGQANQILIDIFGSQGDPPVIWIVDNLNMTMSYKTVSPVVLLQSLVSGGKFPFKPGGVQLVP